MRRFFRYRPGEKTGTIDGLNLFFGALLGANLGTMQGLTLFDYVKTVVVLAGTVVVLRMLSTSERRGPVLATLAFYALLILAMLTIPDMQPEGMSQPDLHRLVATLALWVALVLTVELTPLRDAEEPPKESAE